LAAHVVIIHTTITRMPVFSLSGILAVDRLSSYLT